MIDGDAWLTPCPGRFTPENDPVPIIEEAGWAPGSVWTGRRCLPPRNSIQGQSSLERVADIYIYIYIICRITTFGDIGAVMNFMNYVLSACLIIVRP